jgi:ferredoxin-thioredoxin reductase catalytic subunit
MSNIWDNIIGTKEFKKNLSRIEKIAHIKKYMLNPDTARLEKVIGLMSMNKQSAGKYFCPCKQSHPLDPLKDVTCPCSELDQQIAKDGNCHCRVFFENNHKKGATQ